MHLHFPPERLSFVGDQSLRLAESFIWHRNKTGVAMHIDWTERAWLEWSAPQDAEPATRPAYTRVDSVRPEPLGKIVRLMLRWDIGTRRSFRIVTENGLVLDASRLENIVQDGTFPFSLPVAPVAIVPPEI
jgi:hypothetical protein